jgi:hypothetical protein
MLEIILTIKNSVLIKPGAEKRFFVDDTLSFEIAVPGLVEL